MKLEDILKKGEVSVKLYEIREVWFNLYEDSPVKGDRRYSYGSDLVHKVFLSKQKAVDEAEKLEDSLKEKMNSLDEFDQMRIAKERGVNYKEAYAFRAVVFEYNVPVEDLLERNGETYLLRNSNQSYIPTENGCLDKSIIKDIKFTQTKLIEHKIE